MLSKKYICSCLCALLLSFGVCTAKATENVATQGQHSLPQEAQTPAEIRGELWTGKLYSSQYKAGACIETDGNVRGVLILRLKNGQEDVYHFYGTKNLQGEFNLKHKSGHRFQGHFESGTTIEGKVTTKNGFTINLKGTREQNALLNGPTCRPF